MITAYHRGNQCLERRNFQFESFLQRLLEVVGPSLEQEET